LGDFLGIYEDAAYPPSALPWQPVPIFQDGHPAEDHAPRYGLPIFVYSKEKEEDRYEDTVLAGESGRWSQE
jgi:hypothetical protein